MLKKFAVTLDGFAARWSWRALGTRRALVVATLIAVASFGTLSVLKPPPPPTIDVIVAAADLGVGEKLSASDIRVVRVPPEIVPFSAVTSRDDAVDKILGAPVPAGLFITESALNTAARYDSAQPGTVATPVRFADPQIVKLLQPGDRINVLVAHGGSIDSAQASVVARNALVLAIPEADSDEGGLLGSTSSGGNIAILAVPENEASDLAAASQLGALTIALVQ